MTKLEQVTKGAVENQTEQVELVTRYKAQLAELGVKKGETLKSLERELEIENEIMKARAKEANIEKDNIKNQKTRERVAKFERDYQREISDRKREEIEQQRELDKLYDEAKKKVAERTLSEKEYNEELNKVAQKYKESRRNEKLADARRDFVENGVGSIFGVNSSIIKEVKDGTYKWKLLTDVFKKAVDLFSASVKQSIDANYNTTEAILNGMTASNNMSWNSGEFKLNGRAYQGFSNINNAIKDQLKEEGLYDNIAIKDVMEAANKITVQEGLNASDALTKGLQDTVIKYIVPYLDTSSEAFTNLEYLMPRNIKKYCINCN